MMFAIFSCVEYVLDTLFASWMPLWFELKIFFVFWLQPTKFGGASKLYHLAEPHVEPKAAIVEEYVQMALVKVKAGDFEGEINKVIDWGKTTFQSVTGKATAEAPSKGADASKEVQDDKPQDPDAAELVDP